MCFIDLTKYSGTMLMFEFYNVIEQKHFIIWLTIVIEVLLIPSCKHLYVHLRYPSWVGGLFVYLELIVPLEIFLLIWKRHHCRWRAENFDLCSALMAIEQWGVFYVSHLLWHGPTFYNGHFRGPVTLTTVANVWQWSCPYLFSNLGL